MSRAPGPGAPEPDGPPSAQPTIRARARSREDRAGDPLDGLVNLFDLGIVLSLAFLLASLSSLNLTDDLISRRAQESGERAPAGSILIRRDDEVRTIEIRPGERVLGRGEMLGRVYRLADGRTVIVPERGADVSGVGAGADAASGDPGTADPGTADPGTADPGTAGTPTP